MVDDFQRNANGISTLESVEFLLDEGICFEKMSDISLQQNYSELK